MYNLLCFGAYLHMLQDSFAFWYGLYCREAVAGC